MAELAPSGGAARRLIEQGGAYANGKRIEKYDQLIYEKDIQNQEILLRAGKKRFHRLKNETFFCLYGLFRHNDTKRLGLTLQTFV
jgi:tyrosyl-tRNA synthetase